MKYVHTAVVSNTLVCYVVHLLVSCVNVFSAASRFGSGLWSRRRWKAGPYRTFYGEMHVAAADCDQYSTYTRSPGVE